MQGRVQTGKPRIELKVFRSGPDPLTRARGILPRLRLKTQQGRRRLAEPIARGRLDLNLGAG